MSNQGNKLHSFEWNDESTPWMKGMYAKFNDLKTQNPNLKTLIAVGGWTLGSKPFSKMVATDANRREFVKTSIAFLRKHDFDGLDIDWEYPTRRSGSTAADRNNYIELLKTLKQEFDTETKTTGKPRLILSAAVPAGKSNMGGYNIPEMAKYLDMVNLMTYDLHGSWETKTGHQSGLFKHNGETGDAATMNLDWAANYWVNGGMPASMINVGLAMYGRGFTLQNPGNHDLDSTSRSPSNAGPFTGEKGFMAYYEICELLKTGGTRHYLADQMVPYVVKGSQWIGYEDVDSIKIKVQYIKQHGFGGTMVWALDLDDFHGNCGQGKFPLVNAIKDELKRSGGPVIKPVQQQSTPQVSSQTTTQHLTTTSTTLKPKVINTTKGVHSTRQLGVPATFSCKGMRDGFYPNPSSCDSYYICASGSPFLAHCASGLQYNSKTRYCDWPRNANCTNPSQPNQPSQTGTTASPLNTNGPTKLLVFSNAPNTNTPSNTNSPTKLLAFTNSPWKTNSPTRNPVGTNMPTKLLNYTPAPTNGPTYRPAPTTGPTYVPPPTSTPSPIQTNAPTKLLVFTNAPAFTNAPVQTNAPTQSPTNAPVTSSPNFNTNFCRTKSDGLYSDASDCGSYYQCSFGLTFHEPCAPGTAFNPKQDACDYPFNVPACMNYRG
ncbi:E3.2.1.14 [Mytilus edulis]|uniref:E3.2.1.14 n=1 Tax=Mytilus edulis TaxID=6550 RepID=A0A8S3SJ68_MYTED|nr:E3.2.1.14 [Mytilus edulis]